MSLSSSHQDLFHQPSPAEKISFVQSLIETGDLNADVAMALLKSIHSELAQPQGQDHSLYARYARLMASLQHEMPDVHQHVVTNWQATQPVHVEPEEASAEDGSLETETGGEAKRIATSDVEEADQGKGFWEPEGEMEGSESQAAEPKKEENETREEPLEEPEKPEIESSGEVEETSDSEEGERMATEAAEAAAHMEHAQGEAETVKEEPGEAEPPMEAVE